MEDTTSLAQGATPFDLALWREFQDGLSALMDVPISLYGKNGALIAPTGKQIRVCDAVKATDAGRSLCHETCQRAIFQVLEKNKVYIYKCPANQYIFAVPVFVDGECAFVIIGGHAYLSGTEEKEFRNGVATFGFDELTVGNLRGSLRTMPANSLFTIPAIIRNLAVPFLRCAFRHSKSGRPGGGVEARERLKGIVALQQVYTSLAPVLDREELYDTILEKSSELVSAEKGTLMILDSKDNVLTVKAARGLQHGITSNLRIKVGEGIAGAIAAKGLPVMVKDIEDEVPSWKNRPLYKTKSFISIPLKLENRVIGVINVADKITGGIFSDEDLHLLINFASYASIALERGAYYSMSEELKMLSMTDPLTGLFNRRYFRERLYEEVERVKRHDECFTVFMIDIDNFKSYNDRYGHIAGDEILKSSARTLRDAVRSMDVVARYGGEEFAVILPHTNKKDSSVIAERIRKEIEHQKLGDEAKGEKITICLGVSEFPRDAANIDDLVNKADRAMYMAKRMGKNRVVIYEG